MIRSDASRFPLIVYEWTGTHTEADIDGYFDELRRDYLRAVAEKTVLVTVTTGSASVGARERGWIADRVATTAPEQMACYIAAFVVAPSAVHRGVITALRWFNKDLEKVVAVDTMAEAVRRAEELLASRGCKVPPARARR